MLLPRQQQNKKNDIGSEFLHIGMCIMPGVYENGIIKAKTAMICEGIKE